MWRVTAKNVLKKRRRSRVPQILQRNTRMEGSASVVGASGYECGRREGVQRRNARHAANVTCIALVLPQVSVPTAEALALASSTVCFTLVELSDVAPRGDDVQGSLCTFRLRASTGDTSTISNEQTQNCMRPCGLMEMSHDLASPNGHGGPVSGVRISGRFDCRCLCMSRGFTATDFPRDSVCFD